MSKITEYPARGKTIRIAEYESFADIVAIIEQNDQFHDGTVEFIAHNANNTTIGFKHYENHKIHRLIFTGNVELALDLDLLQRYIYEITYTVDKRIEVSFDGIGICAKSDHVKLEVQELID